MSGKPDDTDADARFACRLGGEAAAGLTAVGVVYLVGLGGAAAAGALTLPPPAPMQLFGALVALAELPLLLALVASLRRVVPHGRRVLGDLALAFTTLAVAAVGSNRFVQLAVVRPAEARGTAGDLARFLPYNPDSALFALELLGYGLFLGLAALCLAPLFAVGGLERGIRAALVAYGLLGLTCAAGHLARNALATALGFAAWGLVLPLAAALLAAYFRRRSRAATLPGGGCTGQVP